MLTPEEQERLREQILVARNQIQSQLARTQVAYQSAAHQEASRREAPAPAEPGRPGAAAAVQQLWQQADEHRKSNQIDKAIHDVDRILAITPTDERAQRWHEDLAFLQNQARQVAIRESREALVTGSPTDMEESVIRPGEVVQAEERNLRYPSAEQWKDLTELRRNSWPPAGPSRRPWPRPANAWPRKSTSNSRRPASTTC